MQIVDQLRARGADAVPLGQDAIVAHLGARRALGDEAARALELGRFLAEQGGVGVATGRSKVDFTRPVGEVVDRAAALAHGAEAGRSAGRHDDHASSRAGASSSRCASDGSAVVGDRRSSGRRGEGSGGAPFVGREAELAQIVARLRALRRRTARPSW